MLNLFNEFNIFETFEDLLKSQKENESILNFKFLKNSIVKKTKKNNENESLSSITLIVEILNLSLIFAPNLIKQYLICDRQKILKYPFFNLIVEIFLNAKESQYNMLVI